MSNKLEFMLRQWGDHYIRHAEYADELGENILYAAGVLQGRVQDSSHSQSKILCEERSKTVRQVDRAVKGLPTAQLMALTGWYCAPLRPDGNPHTEAQVAMKLRMSLSAFQDQRKRAKNALKVKIL